MKILVTSALPYVNNVPHLGNIIGAVLSTDVFVRFLRSQGKNVLHIGGSDEHGTTTETKALEEGVSPKELCDKYHKIHKDVYDWFQIDFDIYGRTSDPSHVRVVQAIFLDLYKNGFIVEDVLEQLYCEHDKMFLADRFVEGTCPKCGFDDARGDQCDNCGTLLNPKELVEPRCKLCGKTPVVKSEKHLFLDLEKLQPELEKWFSGKAWSENALRITKGWLKEGLKKRCITRNLKWGVSVPLKGWEDKVFYVWFDACIGYISITKQLLGENYIEWWKKPEDTKLYQFMGKDNVPFHALIFPGCLLGTRKKWTTVDHLSSVEYLQYEDGKFSKSRGTGIFGDQVRDTGIPSDVFRYYLLSTRPETADATFSWKEFGEKLNNELVATLGNLVNRTLVFIERYLDGKIISIDAPPFWEEIAKKEEEVTHLLEKVQLRDALKVIMEIARMGNVYYQQAEPWKIVKEDKAKAASSLSLLAHLCKDLAILIAPYMPETSQKIFEQLGIEARTWDNLGVLDIAGNIGKPAHLFEKIEDSRIEELRSRFSGNHPFAKLDLRVAEITSVRKHPSADKLFIEELDVGPLGKRQIVSGLVDHYTADDLVGKKIVVVANLKPAKLRGELSEGMLLAAEDGTAVGVVLVDGKPGDQLSLSGVVSNPEKEIDIKEFFTFDFTADNGLFLDGKEVTVNGKSLSIDKNVKGKVK